MDLLKSRLSKSQIKDIVDYTVFRDWIIEYVDVRKGLSDYGSIFLSCNVVRREYDRRTKTDEYRSVDSLKFSRATWADYDPLKLVEPSFNYSYQYEYNPDRVGPLRGYHPIPDYATDSEQKFTRWLLDRIMAVTCHEVQENFYINGERVYDPHVYGEIM